MTYSEGTLSFRAFELLFSSGDVIDELHQAIAGRAWDKLAAENRFCPLGCEDEVLLEREQRRRSAQIGIHRRVLLNIYYIVADLIGVAEAVGKSGQMFELIVVRT